MLSQWSPPLSLTHHNVMGKIISLKPCHSLASLRFNVTLNNRTKTSQKVPDDDNKHVSCLADVNKLYCTRQPLLHR